MSKNGAPRHSMLSKGPILYHMKKGHILIEPFDARFLGTHSYDVCLGPTFFREQSFPASDRKIFNPFDRKHITKYWGTPREPELASTWMKENGPLKNVRPDDMIIFLGPQETILAHTVEFIGGRECICTEMRAKSSVGRIGVTVCKCAGLGGVGFFNRWTMEVTNHLRKLTLVLVVGMPLAQITFHEVDEVVESYAQGGGQYQNSDDPKVVMKTWTPDLMLPRFDRSRF